MGQDVKWHPMFAKLARLVARDLSYSLYVPDPPRADIDWKEAKACGGLDVAEWLRLIPRSSSRNVVIEVQPGVAITVSLQTRSETYSPQTRTPVSGSRLDQALAQLWEFRQELIRHELIENSNVRDEKPVTRKKQKNRKGGTPKGEQLL